jgi:hypothetical protein
MTHIVTTAYRYKPRKRAKAAVIESSAVITANRRRMLAARVFSNAGIVLTVLAGLIPLVASDRAFRWLLALGLVFVGGICMSVCGRGTRRNVTTAYRYKWPPPEGEPLLRLHTDAIQDENDVAMACDCCGGHAAHRQTVFCGGALGLGGKRNRRHGVRGATARTSVHDGAEQNQQPHALFLSFPA